jgi:hypothetical protein
MHLSVASLEALKFSKQYCLLCSGDFAFGQDNEGLTLSLGRAAKIVVLIHYLPVGPLLAGFFLGSSNWN